ncbi:MAG: hypothetical protein K2Q33_01710 [Gammaproteobacteria bacterium]|nr:hypothetical protein [Gammaproteobacteria bacterium]
MGNDVFFNKEDTLKTLADQNDTNDPNVVIACAKLGSEYLSGSKRQADQRLALHYTKKAAEAGYAASCLYLARYYHKDGKIEDSQKYIQRALEHKEDASYDKEGYSQKKVIQVIGSFVKQYPEIGFTEHKPIAGPSKNK